MCLVKGYAIILHSQYSYSESSDEAPPLNRCYISRNRHVSCISSVFFPSYAFQRASFTRLIFLAPRSTLSDLISKRDRDALLVIYRSNRPRVKSWRRDEKQERAKYEMLMRARRPSNIKRVFTWPVLQKKSSIWTHSARNSTYPQDNYRLFSFQEFTQRRKKRPRVRRVVNRSRDDVYLRWIHNLSLCTALTI